MKSLTKCLVVHSSNKPQALITPPAESRTTLPLHQYEWVQYNDKTSQKRARAHVTRRTRKQKEDDEKVKRKAERLAAKESAKPLPQSSVARQVNDISLLTPPHSSHDNESVAFLDLQGLRTSLIIRRTLGPTKADPFGAFPVTLDAKSYALLDHCK